ncbi:FAD/NAD(P)-binding domain-containing protein [Xylariaceae sp. FL0594]|nr:FAD/NAD(P)-binding domain-containing protein [Xylariaceae sp. FL0594]
MGLGNQENGGAGVETFDVLIVGTGISGINAAYRVQAESPDTKLAILEGRDDVGGTWDLFRYPGIRSDSDLYTFGFPWEPWPYECAIAKGPLIKQYMKNCIAKYNLDRYIRFQHHVHAANWSSETEQWTVTAENNGQKKVFKANFLFLGTGYYAYDKPLKTVIPGLESFKGKVIHPQWWPEDYDHSGKKMAVIGSGATTITLIPALSETAAEVTMVQRSPSYVVSQVNGSPATSLLMKMLPTSFAGFWLRQQYLWKQYLAVLLCRYYPSLARRLFMWMMLPLIPERIPQSPHFEPTYTPWEQRACLSPDGDFFHAFRDKPTTNIVTGHIDTVTETGIRMQDGTTIEADAIVTATGLFMRMGGGIEVSVNGEKIDWAGRYMWNGSMIEGVPNLMLVIGYTNASWTLGADVTARTLVRLLKYMKSKGVRTAVPRVPPEGAGAPQKWWQLTSTYSNDAQKRLPIYGSVGPWRPKTDPPLDSFRANWGSISKGLHFSP